MTEHTILNEPKPIRRANLLNITLVSLLCILIASMCGYSWTRHWLDDEQSIVLIDRTLVPKRVAVAPLKSGLGFVQTKPFVTSASVEPHVEHDFRFESGSWAASFASSSERSVVRFRPGEVVAVDQKIASREIKNIWGAKVHRWTCTVNGAISKDGSEFCLSLNGVGGGDAGYTVTFDPKYQITNRRLIVTVTEQLWIAKAHQFQLHFIVMPDGSVIPDDDHQITTVNDVRNLQ